MAKQNDYLEQLLLRANPSADQESAAGPRKAFAPDTPRPLEQDRAIDPDQLAADPDLQQATAFRIGYTPSKWLLEQEAELIVERRALQYANHALPPGPAVHWHDRKQPRLPAADEDIYQWAREQTLTGVCLSGGGIRSATFNLGVLQAMATRGWLDQVDYLSSVSGGGYIHSWLAVWLKRKTKDSAGTDEREKGIEGWRHVMARLVPLPQQPGGWPPQTVWPRQVQWLRRYSNYLTPRKGALSGDTWAALAVWLRNVTLNQGLLIAIFLVVLAVPHLFVPWVHHQAGNRPVAAPPVSATVSTVAANGSRATLTLALRQDRPAPATGEDAWAKFGHDLAGYLPWGSRLGGGPVKPAQTQKRCCILNVGLWGWAPATFLMAVAGVSIGWLLHVEYVKDFTPRRGPDLAAKLRRGQVTVANLLIVLPLLLFGVAMTHVSSGDVPPGPGFTGRLFGLLLFLVWVETFAGGAIAHTVRLEQARRNACGLPGKLGLEWKAWTAAWLALMGGLAAGAGALVGVAIAALVRSMWMDSAAGWLALNSAASVRLVLGALLFFWLPPLTMVLASGMIGKNFPDWLGEWLARIRGYTLLAGLGWVFFFGCSLLMPGVVSHAWPTGWIRWPAILAWAATTLGGVLGGRSSRTSGAQHRTSGPLQGIAALPPYVYIIGLAVVLSLALDRGQLLLLNKVWPHDFLLWVAIIVFFAGFAVLLGFRLDINQFSMHSFYRNRLTRCYLGASNKHRNPSPITGFDETDSTDLSIHTLTPSQGYPGPIPIFCCAMNITTGEDLAWQERKAASFAFTPLYSGYTVGWTQWRKGLSFNGFVPTKLLYPEGPNVATAMAASGAAVSPNWGYHTNPATAFLMTMFDVRLGLWVPNPRRSPAAGMPMAQVAAAKPFGANRPCNVAPASPRFAPWRLLSELLGSVDDTSKYVYLTDGGHFDNMGLYELVRRRCYRIVICDAEEDGKYSYEGIGAAIRKCRIDFGVEIDLDLSVLSPNTQSKLSPRHFARGTIRYPETPVGNAHLGKITYIKASLTARKPARTSPGAPPAVPPPGSVALPDVPGDVQNYQLQHPHFPHDATAEQWFTESQFESYRRLGERVIETLGNLFA